MFSRRLDLAIALVAVVATGAVADDFLYPQPVLPMLVEPVGVIAADLDGDGLLDLVSANRDSGDVAVLMGQADGMFAPDRRFSACGGFAGATFPTPGDFDENGKIDLAVTCGFTGPVSILLGNGDGTFGPSTEYGVEDGSPFMAQTGDFNNDDHLDLIVANTSGPVLMFLGNGDGSFAPEVVLDLSSAWTVAIGDFNGDDYDDWARVGSSNVEVYLGNGDATFAPPLLFPGSGLHIVAVDLSGDEILDLAAAGSNGLSVLLGNGDGTFAPRQEYETDENSNFVVAADFNRDQLLDLAVNNRDGGVESSVSVLLGTGSGLFAPAIGVDPVRLGADSMAVGDFNLDGNPDIVRPCFWCDDIWVMFGDGAGGFTTSLGEGVGNQPSDVLVADLDGDGRPDLAASNEADDTVSVLLAEAAGTFGPETTYPTKPDPSAIVTGEFSGDAVPDLVASNRGNDNLSLFVGTGGDGFAGAAGPPVGTAPSDLAVGDFNEDDLDDLAVTNEGSNDVSILLGLGDGTFAAQTPVPVGIQPSSVAVADFDGDDHDDLAVANRGSHDISVLLGTGSGGFAAAANVPTGSQPSALAVADIDGDDNLDLAVVHEGDDDLRTYWGNGDGSFTAGQVIDLSDSIGGWQNPADPLALIVTDIDGDGLLDVGAGTRVTMKVFINAGGGALEFQSAYAVYGRVSGIASADVNGDALPELIVSNTASDELTIMLNQSGPETLTFTADAGTLVWPAVIGALSYNVYRGNVAALVDGDEDGLPDGGYGTCMTALDHDPTDTFFDEPGIPAAEAGFFYLRSVVDAGGESGLGTTSAGLTRVPTAACP